MAKEIERRFLVNSNSWKRLSHASEKLIQNYLHADTKHSVRVRVTKEKAWLGVKGKREKYESLEFEYPIPREEAQELLSLCPYDSIEKKRHEVFHKTHTWVIDEFLGRHSGLVIAEIELKTPEEIFEFPDWLGSEISMDYRYTNTNLINHQYPLS